MLVPRPIRVKGARGVRDRGRADGDGAVSLRVRHPTTRPPMRSWTAAAFLLLACNTRIPGVEVFLADVPARLQGKRVGLITNASAVDRAGRPDIDLVAKHPKLKLTALLAAEHGVRGTAAAGAHVADEVDSATGVPVILAGDYNVAPTEIDIYPTRSWDDDALIQPAPRRSLSTSASRTVTGSTSASCPKRSGPRRS